ncbi:hypothetical protein ABIB40_002981 [Pedobacter sp. UYP30]|uniref:hypothetical protein n=1 Tax=Pedobacter sp. UYP30 TaxID=1756400 RepID=UPI003399FD42
MDWWHTFTVWFLALGAKYNVSPVIFGIIYIGAIPFFFASLYWTISNIRNKKSMLVPVLLSFLYQPIYISSSWGKTFLFGYIFLLGQWWCTVCTLQ